MRFLQLVNPTLYILVESSDMKAVDGAVVDLEADGKRKPSVLLLIFTPAHARDAVVRVDTALVGERQHRQPRQARKIDDIVPRLERFVKHPGLRLRDLPCAAAEIGGIVPCRKRDKMEDLRTGTQIGAARKQLVHDKEFSPPDTENFPCLALARDCAKAGGTACPAMNGANEEAVAMFLNDKIGFYDIYRLVNAAVPQVPFIADPTLEQILEADRLAREAVRANS